MRPLTLGLTIWLLVLTAALVRSTAWDATPGDPGSPAIRWPGDRLVTRDPAGPTLIMTVHPRCPCSPASLEALRGILARAPRRPRVWILVVRPAGAPVGFEEGPALDLARAIPGARVVIDVDGAEAARLGARTSGHVLLLDAGGTLRFSGGVTSGRGHHGGSAGADGLEAQLGGAPAVALGGAAVYGCGLAEPEPAAPIGGGR